MKNKIILGLLVCVLAIPVLAKAFTLDDLRQQIANLQVRVTQLVAQLNQQQGQQPAWCHSFITNLGVGSTGDEVGSLKIVLEKQNVYAFADLEANPKFDESLASAVVQFQQKYASEILTPSGLKYGTGYVGNATRAKLNKLYGCGNSKITTTTTKSINLIAPNGGEKVEFGKAYNFKWQSVGIDKVQLYLKFQDGATCYLKEIPATSQNTDLYFYDGQQCSNIARTITAGDKYKIFLLESVANVAQSAMGLHDESDNYFTIN
ncbi:MAG: peptidoglycan-binding domain-containing protein [Candidatus Gribaldobacteria bacterium]|nr:peptidoglycan-binding domain-containing protein [Candidatus Gribaldobacteria bacterium]